MKSKKLFLTVALAMLTVGAVQAQDLREEMKSFSYVEVQGGLQLTSTDAKMDKLMTPTAALSLGHYFTPIVGARLHVNAWEAKSGFTDIDKYYKWKYITPDIDLMLNLSNLFGSSKNAGNRLLNVILLGGFGLNYAWNNDELKDLNLAANRTPLAWDKNRLSHNLRAGLRFETNQTKPIGLSLEVNANSLSDRFNSKTNDADDWMFTAMLGLSYRFGQKNCKKEREYVAATPVVVQKQVEEKTDAVAIVPVEKKPEPKPEKKAVVKRETVKLHKEAFYAICLSDNEDHGKIMKEVADFMKQYKDCKIMVVGYADKGTGNPSINRMYAQRRADQFKKDLVKNYGIEASRIKTDSKGDTVQPFAENDKNRCVVVDGEAIKEYTVYE